MFNKLNKKQKEKIKKEYRKNRVTKICRQVKKVENSIKLRAQWYNLSIFRQAMDIIGQFPAYPMQYDKKDWEKSQPSIKSLIKQLNDCLEEAQTTLGLNFQDSIDFFEKYKTYDI